MVNLIKNHDKIPQMAENGLQLVKEKFDVNIVNNKINSTMRLFEKCEDFFYNHIYFNST